jgi:hypothetical protein
MIGSLLLAYAIAGQNPLPPDVTLPEGWQVKYWSSAGFGLGALMGPDKEEIIFPGYEPTGHMAATTREADPAALLVRSIVDGRRVDVAVRDDGQVVVSYLPQVQDGRLGRWSFDYWTKTTSGRQAAQAVMISLTRLDVLRTKDRDAEAAQENLEELGPVDADFPFPGLRVWSGFEYLQDPKWPGFRNARPTEWSVVMQEKVPGAVKWEAQATLVGREIRWGESELGQAWASVAEKGGKPTVAVSTSAKSKGIVMAILMALTYKAPATTR